MIVEFEPWRHQARNSLWLSVMLILAAGGVQTLATKRLGPGEILVMIILIIGVLVIPVTVVKFRRNFRPLLKEYRINVNLERLTLDAMESGHGRETERRSKVEDYRTE